jgi:hypothetical protein
LRTNFGWITNGGSGRLPDAENNRSEGLFSGARQRWAMAAFERFDRFRDERQLSENQRKRFGA